MMLLKSTRQILLTSLVLFCFQSYPAAWATDFKSQVQPLLERYCVNCHGSDKAESFRMDDKDEAFDFIEDDAEESLLYQVLISDDEEEVMPPLDFQHKMSAAEIEVIKNWIDEGAEWPDDAVLIDTSATYPANNIAAVNTDGNDNTGDMATNPESSTNKESQKDAATNQITEEQITGAVGSLHPAIVHLPIGLLLAAGLFALLSLRGNFVMSDCAYYCLWLGTFGAVFSCVSGWFFCEYSHEATVSSWEDLLDMKKDIFWHRTGGLVLAAASFIVALLAKSARNNHPDEGTFWKLLTIAIAGGVGWVGHTGGHLHYGDRLYKDIYSIRDTIMSGGEEEVQEEKRESSEKEDSIDGEIGEVSEPTS